MKKYKVLDTFIIGENTAVMIKANGEGFHNDMPINNGKYRLLSIGIANYKLGAPRDKLNLFIEGKFDDEFVYV